MTCTMAKEIWNNLEVTYEGISQINKSKIYILTREYKIMYTCFTNIINSLTALSKVYSNMEIKLEVNELIGSLTTHEYTLKREKEEGKPKKSLALKVVSYERESDEDEKKLANICLMAKDEVKELQNILE
ncbi:hypothetical protein I3760_14G090100 [Carya illinoinensis]|nr:hypothetical protein I3760_14G090100 [Carya illinoinensis]